MISLPTPTIDQRTLFKKVLADPAADEARYMPFLNNVFLAETDYVTLAEAGKLSMFDLEAHNLGVFTDDEFLKLYTYRMVKRSPGRSYYLSMRGSAPLDLCPFCGFGMVRTLDHYLPKTAYPILCVTPVNLVPSCRDCNTNKDRHVPADRSEEILHPYFDTFQESQRWLFAKVDEDETPSFTFHVEVPASFSSEQSDRLKKHLEVLELSTYFSFQAAVFLSEVIGELKAEYVVGGEQLVRDFLAEEYSKAERNRLNHWKTAVIDAMIKSDWFCGGGFDY